MWNSKWVADKGFGPYDTGEVIYEYIKRSAGRVNPDIVASYVKNAGKPIQGLYVAGNTFGQRFGISYVTPCAGSSIGAAMTNGYYLAEILAGCAPRD